MFKIWNVAMIDIQMVYVKGRDAPRFYLMVLKTAVKVSSKEQKVNIEH